MRDFENFLCFSSAMARCERAGSARVEIVEEKDEGKCGGEGKKGRGKRLFPLSLLVFLLHNLHSCTSALPARSHRAIAEEKQRKFSKSRISSDH